MENILKYAIVLFLVLPMFLMIAVAIFSVILVVSDLPFRD